MKSGGLNYFTHLLKANRNHHSLETFYLDGCWFLDLQSETESRFLFILVIVDFSRIQIEAGVGAEQALANC